MKEFVFSKFAGYLTELWTSLKVFCYFSEKGDMFLVALSADNNINKSDKDTGTLSH